MADTNWLMNLLKSLTLELKECNQLVRQNY